MESKQVIIKVTNKHTGEVAKEMGPMSERKAEKVERGLLMSIDTERWFVDEVSV